jgi:multidrug efflux system membrane fusion protein
VRAHRVAAVIVLIAAGAWVATGKVSSVGSEEAQAAEPPKAEAREVVLRTVAVVDPVFADHARVIRISGHTGPDKQAVLAARSNGIIHDLNVAKGDTVGADQLVMMLEGPEATANLAQAEAQLAQRRREEDVTAKLSARGSASEISLTSARAATAAAEAQLSAAKAALDRLELHAPFAGVVDDVAAERGEWVQAGTPIATILSLDPILVRAEVSELDIGYVAAGARAEVRLVNGERLEGVVRFVAREASEATRTFPVEVALPNPDNRIPAGMTSEITLFAPAVRTVTVPRSIITLSERGDLGLRVIGPDDIARFAAVELIDDTPAGLVLTGVPEDARIVVSGQDLVSDGEKVRAVVAAGVSGAAGSAAGGNDLGASVEAEAGVLK